MATDLEPGAVVVWIRAGAPEYGTVEGVTADTVWVRRVDGHRSARATRFPKSPAEVVAIATQADLVAWLTARARQQLARSPS